MWIRGFPMGESVGNIAIGASVTGGLAGSIIYVDSSLNVAQDNDHLFWDAANLRLGIGNKVPSVTLEVTGPIYINGTTSTSFMIFDDGINAAVSAAGTARLRYNDTLKLFQGSFDGAAWTQIEAVMAVGDAVYSGTPGSVLFVDAGPVLGQDNDKLFWDVANFRLGIAVGTSPQASLDVSQVATTTTTAHVFQVTGAAHTTLTTLTEWSPIHLNLGQTYTWANGAIGSQRFVYVAAPTIEFASGSNAVTNAATLYVEEPLQGTYAVLTNRWAAWLAGGLKVAPVAKTTTLGATTTVGQWIDVAAQTHTLLDTGTVATYYGTAIQAPTVTKGTAVTVTDFASLFVAAPVAGGSVTATNRWAILTTGACKLTDAVNTAGTPLGFLFTGAAHTGMAIAESNSVNFNLNQIKTFSAAGGTVAVQRAFYVQAPTYNAAAAMTITDAATVGISGAPVKGATAVITNTHALLIQQGTVSTASASYGLTVNAQLGASANYAAAFLGGNVGIGNAAPTVALDVTGAITASTTITSTAGDLVLSTSPTITWDTVALLMRPTAYSSALGAGNVTGQVLNLGSVADPLAGPICTLTDTSVVRTTWYGTVIQAPTVVGAASLTITDVATMFIGAPTVTTATGTNKWGISTTGGLKVAPAARSTASIQNDFQFTGAAHTAMTIAEQTSFSVNLGQTQTFAAGGGTVATQRAVHIISPTYAASTNAVTLTDSATFSINGSPWDGTNVTSTNSHVAWFRRDYANNGSTPLGTTQMSGVLISNETNGPLLPSATATQQYSPMLVLRGVGYTAAATYASQEYTLQVRPTSATAGDLYVLYRAGAGAWSAPGFVQSTGRWNFNNVLIGLTATGTAQTIGLNLDSYAAATVGAQKFSPMLLFTSRGWKTAATAASENSEFAFQGQVVQGVTHPQGILALYSRINYVSGTYTKVMTIGGADSTNTGEITPGTTGSAFDFPGNTWTDSATAGSGTATAFTSFSIQGPTLAATNALVTTTDAATLYVGSVIAGTNQTITHPWSIWAAGAVKVAPVAMSGAPSTTGSFFDLATATFTDSGTPTGTGDTIGGTAPAMTLTDSAGAFRSTDVGGTITLAGWTAVNNGTFRITGWTSATQISFANAAGTGETAAGTYTVKPGLFASIAYQAPTLAATNATTTLMAATVYIAGPPAQGTNQTLGTQNTTALLVERNNLTTTKEAPGIVLRNSTDATAAATVQNSPSILWDSSGWDTDGSGTPIHTQWAMFASSPSAATVTPSLTFAYRSESSPGTWGGWNESYVFTNTNFWASSFVGSFLYRDGNATLSVRGQRDAADAGADVDLGARNTRTAGGLVTISNGNGGTTVWKVMFNGANIRTPQAVSYAFATTPALGRLTDVAAVAHTATDLAGTVATWYGHAFNTPTLIGAGVDRIITDVANLFVAGPVITTANITATNQWGIYTTGGVKIAPIAKTTTLGAANTVGQQLSVAPLAHTLADATVTRATYYAYAFQAPTVVGPADLVISDLTAMFVGAPVVTTAQATRSYSIWAAGNVRMDGAQYVNVTTVSSATYTVLATDFILNCNSHAAAITDITLPTAASCIKRVIIIKDAHGDAGSNTITITVSGAGTIDGAANKIINAAYNAYTVYSDGTEWHVA